MVNLVIVSHSAQLGEGVGALARQMLMGDGCKIAIAAGIDDPENPIGTDPIKVMEAIESVADTDHVLVMMDIGSALLSAETALELLDPNIAARVRLCAAPLVEGTLAATVSAAAGADVERVIRDAMNALDAKCEQLGLPSSSTAKPTSAEFAPDANAHSVAIVVKNPNGIHVRPASRLVSTLSGFNADMWLEKNGKCVVPDSLNQIALLQVRCNDTLRLIAKGEQAEDALAAFKQLAAENFGESLEPVHADNVATHVPSLATGTAFCYTPYSPQVSLQPAASLQTEQQQLRAAIQSTLNDLNALTALAEEKYSADIAAIFSGHHTLLDDPELFDMACDVMREKQCSAAWAWHQVLSELSQQYLQLDDPYLQARYIDIEDLLSRSLQHLTGETEQIPAFIRPTILVADVIYPSTVLQLDPKAIRGVCLRDGSEASHPAIIARAMGLCWLCQQGDVVDSIKMGDTLTLDGVAKRIILAG